MAVHIRRSALHSLLATLVLSIVASSASAQSTYFKFELCTADKFVKDSGVAINQTFYKKYVNAGPMAVLSSSKVPDIGLVEMANWIRIITANLPAAILTQLVDYKVRAVPMHETEFPLIVPEFTWLDPSWMSAYSRGLGPSESVPVTVAGMEYILPQRDLGYDHCTWVHELGHTVHLAMMKADPTMDQNIREAYNFAMASGLYGGAGIYGSLNPPGAETREGIKTFDPKLAELLAEIYSERAPLYRKPDLTLLEQSIVPCGSGLADVDGDGQNDVSAAPVTTSLSMAMGTFSAVVAMLMM